MKTYGISGTSAAVRETREPAQELTRHTARAAANHLSKLEQVKHDRRNLDRDMAALARVQASRPLKPPGRRG